MKAPAIERSLSGVIAKSFREIVGPGSVAVLLGLIVIFIYHRTALLQNLATSLQGMGVVGAIVTAFISQIVFCALLPAVGYLMSAQQRPKRLWLVTIANGVWFGLLGVLCLGFYVIQERLFGVGNEVTTIIFKTLFDQLVFNPLVLAPLHASFFFWEARDFSWSRTQLEWPSSFIRSLVLPNLLANYLFAIPIVVSMYTLPLAMRVPFMGVVALAGA